MEDSHFTAVGFTTGVSLRCLKGERGWQLPEWMRYRQFGSPSPVPKGEGYFDFAQYRLGGTLNWIKSSIG